MPTSNHDSKPAGSPRPAPGSRPKENADKKPGPAPTDDRPQREDEYLSEFLNDPSPEDAGKQSGKDEKGVIPGKRG
jgi:hypothetical protein